MITIFNGRSLGLHDNKTHIYVQLAVEMRQHLHVFNNGRNLNSFAVFMAIALHADANGWAWPSLDLLGEETGLSERDTLSRALHHLETIRLEEQRILEVYQERRANGTWGRMLYRIFPDLPTEKNEPPLTTIGKWEIRVCTPDADLAQPDPVQPDPVQPGMVNPPLKENQVKAEPKPKAAPVNLPAVSLPAKAAGRACPKPSIQELERVPVDADGHDVDVHAPSECERWLAGFAHARSLTIVQASKLKEPMHWFDESHAMAVMRNGPSLEELYADPGEDGEDFRNYMSYCVQQIRNNHGQVSKGSIVNMARGWTPKWCKLQRAKEVHNSEGTHQQQFGAGKPGAPASAASPAPELPAPGQYRIQKAPRYGESTT